MLYRVEYLQAVEPDELTKVDGITVTVVEEADSMGFPRVDVEGESRSDVASYVLDNWGDEDPEWFTDYVVNRIKVVR